LEIKMTTPFSRTFSRLLADHARAQIWTLLAALVMLGCWCWWAARAHVTLYEVSPQARIELDSATYPIESPLAGRVVQTKLHVGQSVHAGEVLVEIDPVPAQLQLRQQEAAVKGLEPEIARLRSQIVAEEQARQEEQKAAAVSAEEARNKIREAEATANYDEAELGRTQKLQHEGLAPARDVEKAEAELHKQRATVAALETAALRIPQEQSVRDRERDVRVARLNGEIATLETQRTTLATGIDRFRYEIERREVRALVDGYIGESAVLRPGAVVQAGEKLASVVPSGRLFVAAQFPAQAAFGRIRPGQAARLRLDAFPWSEFGAVCANVSQVAQEIREGNARVELQIEPGCHFRGKLEHGMPGTVEVAVERVTPLSLILRTAGQWLTAHQ
jgi:membrane fusion protein (multidrug efflux system)